MRGRMRAKLRVARVSYDDYDASSVKATFANGEEGKGVVVSFAVINVGGGER